MADVADEYPEPALWPAGLSVIVAADGEELPAEAVRAVGDEPGVYVIVRTTPEDEPAPGAVYVNTTTEGDWLLDAPGPPADGPLPPEDPVAVAPGLVVSEPDWPSLPGLAEP